MEMSQSSRQPIAIQHIRDRFGAMASVIESESFRKGWISLSVEELYERLQLVSEDLYSKILRSVPQPELLATITHILSMAIAAQHGSDAPTIMADLMQFIPLTGLFYATIDTGFLDEQVRELVRMRQRPQATAFNHSPSNNSTSSNIANHQHQNQSLISNVSASGEKRYHAAHACVDFMHGRCSRGDGCRFSHSHLSVPPRNFANQSVSSLNNYNNIVGGPHNSSLSSSPMPNNNSFSASMSHADNLNFGRAGGNGLAASIGGTSSIQTILNLPPSGTGAWQYSTPQDALNLAPSIPDAPPPPPPQALQYAPSQPRTAPSPSGSYTSYSPYTTPSPTLLSPSRNNIVSQHYHSGAVPNDIHSAVPPPSIDTTTAPTGQIPTAALARRPLPKEESLDTFLEKRDLSILIEPLQSAGYGIASLKLLSKSQFENALKVKICSRSLRTALWEALHPDGASPSTPPPEQQGTTAGASALEQTKGGISADKERLRAFMASNSIRSSTESDVPATQSTASVATQALKSLLLLPTPISTVPSTGTDLRAVIWVGGTSSIKVETVKDAVAAVGTFFEFGYAPSVVEGITSDWMYFKLSAYDKDLQAKRYLITCDGQHLPIVDRTLFAAGHKDDGRPPFPPEEKRTSHTTPKREGSAWVPRSSEKDTICKYYLSDRCSRGTACPYKHDAGAIKSPNKIRQRT